MTMMRGAAAYSRGAGAYARMNVESGVLSASPHQLINLLFDGVQNRIRTARLHLEQGNAAEKGVAIGKAMDIVSQGLLGALDRDQGGEVAENLAALYEYVNSLLLRANIDNDVGKLDEAARLLEEVGSAWRDIGQPSD